MIFDEPTLRKLTRLTLVAGRVRAGRLKGERRSTKRGVSLEFADYRNYTPGDDLRRLDWNVYARLDRPFLKLFEEEEDLAVYSLVDGSRSMDWGAGETNKFQYALRLAGALGAIALANGDGFTAGLLSAAGRRQQLGPLRGQPSTVRLLRFLEGLSPAGETDLNQALRDWDLVPRRPGLAFLLTDLFSPAGYLEGISRLLNRGYEVALIHLLAPDELDPPLAGDLRLVDVETGAAQEVSLDGGLRGLYRQRLADWQAGIRLECRKRQVRYLPVDTRLPWDRLVLHEMRKLGVVK